MSDKYIVVCTDLHGAIGTYDSREEAGEVAMGATRGDMNKTGCVYKVVQYVQVQ